MILNRSRLLISVDFSRTEVLRKNDLAIIVWSVVDKFLVTGSIAWAFYAINMNYYGKRV